MKENLPSWEKRPDFDKDGIVVLKRQVSYFYFLTVVQIRTQILKIVTLCFLFKF